MKKSVVSSRDAPKPEFHEGASLTWRLEREGRVLKVYLTGEIDENADLDRLADVIRGKVSLDLAEIRRINSAGVREWVNFIRGLPRVSEIFLERCSPAITNQLNMIYNFRGRAKIRSFYAPYVCEHCDAEVDVLLDLEKNFPDRDPSKVPEIPCPECGRPLTFDDIPERYFSFIVQV